MAKEMEMVAKRFFVVLFLSFSPFQAYSQEYHFFGYHLAAPPEIGSDVYKQDFLKLHDLQENRTPNECLIADSQSSFTLEDTFGPQTGILTESELRQVKVLSLEVMAKAGIAVYYYKTLFGRPRPFSEDKTLTPCIGIPNDHAYPSGHAAVGYALALVLSEEFPDKREIIMKQGFQIGENRLIGGVHHPSDVEAGRALAKQMVDDLY